jgi:HEAT repeat protein
VLQNQEMMGSYLSKMKWPFFIFFLAAGLLTWWRQESVSPVAREELERQKKALAIINDPSKQDSASVYLSLLALQRNTDPKLSSKVIGFIHHPDSLVRAGAVAALGLREDEASLKAVHELEEDQDPLVRSHLLHIARQHPHARRASWLQSVLKESTITPPEEAEALAALYLAGVETPEGIKAKAKLLLKAGESNARAAPYFIEANTVFEDDPQMKTINRKVLEGKQVLEMTRVALQSLIEDKDPKIMNSIEHWVHHQDQNLRLIAIPALVDACPKNRWELIESGYAESKDSAEKAAWLLVAAQIGGKKAQDLIGKALEGSRGSNDPKMLASLESLQQRDMAKGEAEACANR